jgi:cell division protein FtsW
MIKEQSKNPDFILLGAVATAVILGVLILSSASALLSQSKYQDSYYLIRHQLLLGIIPGLIAAAIAYKFPIDFLRKGAIFFLLTSVVLLLMIFVPHIGFSSGGAQRWVHLGFATVQPSEILKPIFIIYLASWLASRISRAAGRRNAKPESEFGNTLWAFLVLVGFIGFLLIKQPDLSTFGIVALTAFAMYFFADTPLKHTFFMIAVGGAILLALVYFEPYRLERFSSWMSPASDPLGKSFQANQALILSGSGSLFGEGFGSSSSKSSMLPEMIGDSVFAPYAQEVGFAGCILLVAIFAVFAWRGFRVARLSGDKFEYLVACGITVWITLQALINMSSTLRLIPLSGVPLPFISYGGTAVAMELAAVGLLLNISRHRAI